LVLFQFLYGVTRFQFEGKNRQPLTASAVDSASSDLESLARFPLRGGVATRQNDTEYPSTLQGLFAIEWEFPTVEPPAYLLELNPALYQQEKQRIVARFDLAVQMAQEAFTSEFSKLVAHLTDRISGEGKVFRDSAVQGLQGFFERSKSLNVHSSKELDDLVAQAQKAVQGVSPKELRDSDALRRKVAEQLQAVSATLETLLVDAPPAQNPADGPGKHTNCRRWQPADCRQPSDIQ
jgi:hypothetical protein